MTYTYLKVKEDQWHLEEGPTMYRVNKETVYGTWKFRPDETVFQCDAESILKADQMFREQMGFDPVKSRDVHVQIKERQ